MTIEEAKSIDIKKDEHTSAMKHHSMFTRHCLVKLIRFDSIHS